jgi:hypothetical protein
MSSLVSEAGVLGLTMAAVSRGTRKDAVELVRTVAGVESSDGAAAETLEDVVDLVVEMPCEEVKEVVAEAGSLEAVPLGARRAAVERGVAGEAETGEAETSMGVAAAGSPEEVPPGARRGAVEVDVDLAFTAAAKVRAR